MIIGLLDSVETISGAGDGLGAGGVAVSLGVGRRATSGADAGIESDVG